MSKKSMVLIGPYTTMSGYGVHSRSIIRSLISNKRFTDQYDLRLIATPWGSTPQNALDATNPDDKLLLDMNLENNQIKVQPDISVQITIPSEFQKIGRFSIGITAGTEASLAPVAFIQNADKVDLILTPSQFTKDVLLHTKIDERNKDTNTVIKTVQITKPIEVLFEPLDLEVWNKGNIVNGELKKTLDSIKEPFAFLFVGHYLQGNLGHDRKDVGMLIKTFFDTFKRKAVKNYPALILKTSGAGFSITERDQIIDKVQQIREMVREQGYTGILPNVYLLNGELTDAEMNTLYNHPKVKAFISFSHGEGCGLPLLEFTTTGKPVITSNYSGPLDFLNPEYSVLLPGKMIKIDRSAVNEWIPDGSEWFQVNYPYASQILNDVYEKYDKYLEKSRKHIKYTKENFSMEKMSEKFLEILEKYITLSETPKTGRMTLQLPKLKKEV